ncbi:3-oxoacyl-ACP synthase III family protein [Bdellovibrio sp. HCB337]|uniref:3-oxoacyl-ACP synthase III family protein n=1 Tax=Bdellovibrio sp. HCB337 TaxID=3394358 RepID=UPI0039A73BDA
MNLSSEIARTAFQARISGVGSYLPTITLTNSDLERMVDTSNEWILERTGIQKRHVCPSSETTSDLALRAAQAALSKAQLSPQDLDAIIVATVTPDQPLPSTACFLQAKLGCRQIMAFDVVAACSGFLYSMNIAHDFIRAGTYRHILVVGAETLTRMVNYQDRQSCILFGDGAGAVVISKTQSSESSSCIMSSQSVSSGAFTDILQVSAGASRFPVTIERLEARQNLIEMQGREVFKSAVQFLRDTCLEALNKAGLTVEDVDWFLIHQANLRIIEAVAKQLKIPIEKIPSNIREVGNTSSASIPILMSEKIEDGTLQRGQVILMAAFGAGLTSAATILRY